jgi:hypothetical protein
MLRIIFQLEVYRLLMEHQIGLVQQQILLVLKGHKELKVTLVPKVIQVPKELKVIQV